MIEDFLDTTVIGIIEMEHKICLVGAGGVGKTTYIYKKVSGHYKERYVPTLGVENTTVTVDGVAFRVWDCAGTKKYAGLGHGYYFESHGALIFFDKKSSFEQSLKYAKILAFLNGNIPIVFVWSKYHSDPELEKEVLGKLPFACPLIKINTEESLNLDTPFLALMNLAKFD
jgi:small GTP-binding protein